MSTSTLDPARAVSTAASGAAPSMRRTRAHGAVLRHAALVLFGLFMLYPLIWMAVSAFKPSHLVLTDPSIIPTELTLENFVNGWVVGGFPFWVFFGNSLVIALSAILGNLLSCSLTAYALARLEFRARNIYFAIVLVTVMLPMHAVVIPQYIVFSNLGLVNTFVPLILPKFLATDAFFIFLMVQFIRGIPRQLDEAAAIDGAGPFRVFVSIILPLMKPALITTAIFTFIWTWNDFLGPLIFLTDSDAYTVQLALRSFIDASGGGGGSSWGSLFAMSTVSLLPIFLVFLVGQRYLVRGIATTGGR